MRIPLQEIGHKDSDYERPNQDWVCGWAQDGDPCKFGPDGKGHCTAHAQARCHPAILGDRWTCTRAEAFGGACADGPRPDGSCCSPTPAHAVCQPRRSIRAKRGRTAALVTAFSVGFLLLMLGGPWRHGFVSPGELSSVHLAIEGKDGAENCVACHQQGNAGVGSWLKMALHVSAEGEEHHARSEQCLTCHFNDDAQTRQQAMLVHGFTPVARQNMTLDEVFKDSSAGTEKAAVAGQAEVPAGESAAPQTSLMGTTTSQLLLANLVHGPTAITDGKIACSSCHREHRGTDHQLNAMTDAQCQVCHQTAFESFNNGHPRFSHVPRLTAGITFDHARHQQRFAMGELDCGACHMPDALGRTMAVKSFENACQGCHEQGSSDHHGDAITKQPLLMLQLPELEFEDPVYWPEEYAFAEALTPMMVMLLAGDDQALPLIESIYDEDGAAGDLYEWLIETDDNDEPELRAELAAALKRLVADLADYTRDGAQARSERLAKSLGTVSDDRYVQNLASELASANFVMQIFKQRYLPQLAADLEGEEVSADDDELREDPWMTSATMSGWRADSDDGSISYRPLTHADGLLKYWMDALKVHSTAIAPTAAGDASAAARAMLRKQVYAELKSDFNSCTKCHTQSEQAINWSASARAAGSSGFAKFSHSPHMAMLPDQDNCTSCHMFNSGDVDAADAGQPRGFMPHSNERCESCHAPGRANNSCLNCHQYHEHRP